MKLKKSSLENIPRILEIIDDARVLLKSLGINQWQNGYPNARQIEDDIANNESYIIINNNSKIIATSMFSIRKDPTYKKIIDGNWIISEDKRYGVIHRLAISKEYRKQGIASYIFDEFHQKLKIKSIQSLKIDTHKKNIGMQSLVKKIGYQYCGIIYTSYGDKRLAFERVI